MSWRELRARVLDDATSPRLHLCICIFPPGTWRPRKPGSHEKRPTRRLSLLCWNVRGPVFFASSPASRPAPSFFVGSVLLAPMASRAFESASAWCPGSIKWNRIDAEGKRERVRHASRVIRSTKMAFRIDDSVSKRPDLRHPRFTSDLTLVVPC